MSRRGAVARLSRGRKGGGSTSYILPKPTRFRNVRVGGSGFGRWVWGAPEASPMQPPPPRARGRLTWGRCCACSCARHAGRLRDVRSRTAAVVVGGLAAMSAACAISEAEGGAQISKHGKFLHVIWDSHRGAAAPPVMRVVGASPRRRTRLGEQRHEPSTRTPGIARVHRG